MPNAIFTCPAPFLMLAFIAFPCSTNEPAANAATETVRLYIHKHVLKLLKTLGGRPASRTESIYLQLHTPAPRDTRVHMHTPSHQFNSSKQSNFLRVSSNADILLPSHSPSLCKRLPQNLCKIPPSNQPLCYQDFGACRASSHRNTNCSRFSSGFLPPLLSKTLF